ncbi:MFS transporter [Chromohalobacter canadensis]|uniref:MFS transporter n=1 Tax=Chromohalobacter moromii TaxID=2860329 RepID=A0A9X3B320_9GAMM|nr:MFS transporter [Chromohalobacter canadensis]MCT8470777.1 MFS transporter [Chromohalobacter canadensis]MCT8497972.1 MFS transporter [Chromohalobacter canadensis]MCT8504344.1 MFS transporter [Chromohalobacter moromii]
MTTQEPQHSTHESPTPSRWVAVFSLTMGVFSLVMAEFLPASLLTPMADSLMISEGQAGQAVTVTAVVALLSGLLVTSVTQRLDRRHVLLAFSVLMIAANLMVAFAPHLAWLLVGRVLLGVALGGFWALSAATVMRLVSEHDVPRAMSLLFTGVPIATISAAALGSYLGDMIGWRNVFLLATALSVLTLVLQYTTLPRMAPERPTPLGTLVSVMKRPGMAVGIVAILLVFCGHFAFFTYVRPFLEGVSRMGINELSSTLLAFGVANFVGTLVAGYLLERSLRLTLLLMPLIMGVLGWLLATLGGISMGTDVLMVALWGFAFGAVPVAWSTWITRVVPDEAESGGGLIVASIQLAIALGAAVGGVMFDISGVLGVCATAGTMLLAAAALVLVGVRTRPTVSTDGDAVAKACQ